MLTASFRIWTKFTVSISCVGNHTSTFFNYWSIVQYFSIVQSPAPKKTTQKQVFTNSLGDLGSIPGRIIPKTLKMVLNTSLLNTQQYKVLSRVKWSNPGKGVAPSPKPQCSSYWKGSLLVALDYGCQLYLLTYNKLGQYMTT